MADRRRINPPLRPTTAPIFIHPANTPPPEPPHRTRPPNEIRKIFLQTGLTPSASGSAYLELEPSPRTATDFLFNSSSSLKITCTVHGPRPLPRSVPFSPHLLLSANVKFVPFASWERRGYIRDASERDLAVHVETALRGLLISERWPKSGVDVVITVLEGEDDGSLRLGGDDARKEEVGLSGWGLMSVLSGCITVTSAAIADAGIDCVDLVSGGVAGIVRQRRSGALEEENGDGEAQIVLDPCPSEHASLVAVCVVGYLQSRDEITEIWTRGDLGRVSSEPSTERLGLEGLMDRAVEAAVWSRAVLEQALRDSVEFKSQKQAFAEAPGRAKRKESG
ncbi:MAG: hypothetical protein LQ343_004718 [Gyalolechia ehrenbergii]|nr:MAG: hypothetical protein LQ343_004718 [Gyalolechia ehrenbergii]